MRANSKTLINNNSGGILAAGKVTDSRPVKVIG